MKQLKARSNSRPQMQAVTIRQPLASAVLAGPGPFEHPGWRTDHRGPLLIHAAKRECRRGIEERADRLAAAAEYSALLGVADLVDCVATEREGGGPDEVGYTWVFANPRPFARPIPYVGRLGLFGVADEPARPGSCGWTRARMRVRSAARLKKGINAMPEFARKDGEQAYTWKNRLRLVAPVALTPEEYRDLNAQKAPCRERRRKIGTRSAANRNDGWRPSRSSPPGSEALRRAQGSRPTSVARGSPAIAPLAARTAHAR